MVGTRHLVLCSVSVLAVTAPAFAQLDTPPAPAGGAAIDAASGDQPATSPYAQQEGPALSQTGVQSAEVGSDDIIVTGTLLRGVDPVGTKVIGIDKAAVEASGASTVTQLLQTVPQFASFNTLQAPIGSASTITTNRPNLRNLQAGNTNGAASTLLLIDGHRVAGAGINQTSPDLDTIAPGAIERVEIVPDGGSSIYGADAVGGVLNFITRKTFDGIGADGRYGFADNYQTRDGNVTVGKSWNGGGAYVTYNYSSHDALFGRDLGYVRQFQTQIAGVAVPTLGIECQVPNVRVVGSSNIYGLPFTPNAAAKLNQPNQCDYSDFATVYPKERRHAGFASLTQDLNDAITFEMKGFLMDRKQRAVTGFFRGTKTLGTGATQLNSPFRSQNIIGSATEAQTVSFGFGEDDAQRSNVHLRTWGLTPSFTARLGDAWRARALLSYSESLTKFRSTGGPGLLGAADTALNNAIRAGLFNPYNPASSNAAALDAIGSVQSFARVRQTQLQTRGILDGDLFELPGGTVKVALGVEYMRETFRTQKGDMIRGSNPNVAFPGLSINGVAILPTVAAIPIFRPSRNVKSAFGELVLPIVKDVTLLREVTISASGRYDDYSDFGDTFNPKVGITWKPFDALRLRAQGSRSFAAPSLANSANADPSTASYSTGAVFNIFVTPAAINALRALGFPAPTAANSNILTLGGGSNFLRPQKARILSLGADLDPFRGMRLSGTYWNIKYKDLIASPVGTAAGNPPLYFQQFLNSYKILPTQADVDGLLAQATRVSGTPCTPVPQCLYVIEFNGTQNLGRFHQSGVDFSSSYVRELGFGSVDFNFAGTYLLNRKQSISATAPLVNQFPFGFSRLSFRTTLGAQIENLRAQATLNHTAGFSFPENPGLAPFYPAQSHNGDFNTVDLFFRYDFNGEGIAKDLALTLTVTNVLDEDPPVRYVGGSTPAQFGYANGTTIGRLFQFGLSKKF